MMKSQVAFARVFFTKIICDGNFNVYKHLQYLISFKNVKLYYITHV